MAYKFTDDNFKTDALESSIPVVVDFYADWCGPCKMMAPVIDELAGDYEGKVRIGKVNTDENRGTASKYNVMSIPTILFIKNGEVVDQVVGAVPKTVLEQKINSML
ncbi:thioredoxin [Cellulosilyticum lentocellum]|uniref:Thioredoxin n=1 Tax=Cellulosilyticum lentocellum (strain ATCC 49066 / DSM 5427 / NCIMB 11756 / RHM5) TaxID=642492 RepID=F2JNU7_CELLD|nr:thioredoxin [Cellulosilyticum lentocellum]ADZ82445.1 thioredoxin [Cellulosilyticum lentocellum DSM 5427]